MFIENKYKKTYFAIVERAKTREIDDNVGTERHHIIPKSLGGTNAAINLVNLTYREHYICHYLLTKMCLDKRHKRSMAFAFFRMKSGNGKIKKAINSRLHEILKKSLVEEYLRGESNPFYGKGFKGEENHFYGKKHSEETRKKIATSLVGKNRGPNNHFFGKQHSPSTKEVLRQKKSIPIKVFFEDETILEFPCRGDLGEHLGKSRELGAKLVKKEFRHLHSKYGISQIEEIKNHADS